MASSNPSRPPRSSGKRTKAPNFILLGILAIAALVAIVSFVRESIEQHIAHNTPNPIPATPTVLATAENDYNSHCASCHGSTGDGQGDKAGELWTKPTDFRDTRLTRRTDGDFYWVISRGSWPMPAFQSKLTDAERWQLVDYIRTFTKPAASKPATH